MRSEALAQELDAIEGSEGANRTFSVPRSQLSCIAAASGDLVVFGRKACFGEGKLSPTMRQHHVAGERVFVDYAGDTVEVIDGATGEVRTAQIFADVLGASNYTYVEAAWTQSLPDWIGTMCACSGSSAACPNRSSPTT